MSLVIVKNKFQIVIPQTVRDEIGVSVGDVLEAKAERGKIVFQPKAIVDRDQYTPAQRRSFDAQLARSRAEHKQGKSFGPFKTRQEMVDFLHQQPKPARVPRARKSS